MIQISDAAIAEIHRLRQRQAQPDAVFRLKVAPGGCAGLLYLTQFDTPTSTDQLQTCKGLQIAIDPQSASYLTNLSIDFSEDLMGGSFQFQNPNAAKNCGCGVSFALTES